MNYEVLEQQIFDKLSPMGSVSGITVVKMPESEQERRNPYPGNARITVIYAGSEYPDTISTSQVSQSEKIFIQILVESIYLRGPQGVYSLISVIKSLLIGFSPSFCKRIQVLKHHTIGGDDAEKINGTWNYNIVFQTEGVTVENFTEDLTVLLKKITLIDRPDGETNIIPNPNN